MRRLTLPIVIAAISLTAGGLWPLQTKLQTTNVTKEEKKPEDLYYSIPLEDIQNPRPERKGMAAIKNPVILKNSRAAGLLAGQIGIVVVFGNEQRFYPYSVLTKQNIINDTVGSTPVLISFCVSCYSGVVFSRELDGESVEFEISGKTYRSDWLLVDTKQRSLWWQISGEAVAGRMLGKKLEQLTSQVMTFAEYSRAYPSGTVISLSYEK